MASNLRNVLHWRAYQVLVKTGRLAWKVVKSGRAIARMGILGKPARGPSARIILVSSGQLACPILEVVTSACVLTGNMDFSVKKVNEHALVAIGFIFLFADLIVSEPMFSSSIHGLSSFAGYHLPMAMSNNMELEFKIKPNTIDQIALLLFIGQHGFHDSLSDHMAVSYVKGYIVLTWNLGSGSSGEGGSPFGQIRT